MIRASLQKSNELEHRIAPKRGGWLGFKEANRVEGRLLECHRAATGGLHDAVGRPKPSDRRVDVGGRGVSVYDQQFERETLVHPQIIFPRSEEHTSELQSLRHLVCR